MPVAIRSSGGIGGVESSWIVDVVTYAGREGATGEGKEHGRKVSLL